MRKLLAALTLLIFSLPMQAQIEHVPSSFNAELHQAHKQLEQNPTVRNEVMISIPFMDDFSYDGPYPNTQLWTDNQVYVNKGFGHEPPSIGVATFDGLKADGTPYDQNTGYGPTDTLTSAEFLLGAYGEIDSIFLSFFLQPKGKGYFSPAPEDSIFLEFKNDAGTWDKIMAIPGPTNPILEEIIPFEQRIVPVLDAQYLYDGFQFRFRTWGSRKGSRDQWHLDYVRMTDNRNLQDSLFNDLTFSELPSSFLKEYTAMPWDHYNMDPTNLHEPLISFDLFNHFNEAKSPILQIEAKDLSFGSTVLPAQTTALFASSNVHSNAAMSQGFSAYDFSGISPSADFVEIQTMHFFDNIPNQELTSNDSVTFTTVFDDYFAYDDGSAESHILAQGVGTQIAVRYHAYKADTLRGIYIQIPHVNGDVSDQLMFFRVWTGDLSGSPIYEPNVAKRPIYVDSLNGFTTYSFGSIPIPEGDFYVAWLQGTATQSAIPVGLDRNNPAAINNNYYAIGGVWEPFPTQETFRGALMIRPIFSSSNITNTKVQSIESLNGYLNIFPNPVRNVLHLDVLEGNYADYEFELYNSMGQLIQQGPLQAQLSSENLAKGMYFLKITSEDKQFNHKFIKLD